MKTLAAFLVLSSVVWGQKCTLAPDPPLRCIGQTEFKVSAPIEKLDILMMCMSVPNSDKTKWYLVKKCEIQDGHTFEEVLNQIGKERNDEALCGDWGPWIHDSEGNIIGKFRNPPCPKKAK